MNNLGFLYEEMGKPELAKKYFILGNLPENS